MATYYGSDVLNGTLTTASTATINTGGTETSKTTTVSGGGHFCEIYSQGGSQTAQTSIGSPSGKGWVTAAPGSGSYATGNWSASFTASFGSFSSGNLLTVRFYRYSSGTYTSIGTINATVTGTAKTTYSFSATSMSTITFGATDLLYYDLWLTDTSGTGGDNPVIYESTSATAGVANDAQITTSTFSPANTTKSVGARTRLSVLVSKVAGARTRLRVVNTIVLGARTLLRVQKTISLGTRVRISIKKSLTAGVRALLRVLSTKTVGIRTILIGSITKSTGARTRLSVLKSLTTGARLILHSFASKSLGVRALIRVQRSLVLGTRVRLRVQRSLVLGARLILHSFASRTLGTRVLIRVLKTVVVGVRLHLFTSLTKSVGVRVRLAGIASGKFGVWANGTGTATYQYFRATQYPDPALSLAPVLPRLDNSTVAWDEFIPTNGSRTIKTSLDGVNWTDVTSSNGGTIPGLTGQPDATIDVFTANTSANYTNTSKSGGSAATATYDTANSRITLSGGSGGLYLNSTRSDNDVDLIADMDESDAGGLVWRFVDTNNYYELGAYDDSSSGGFTNQLRLYKVVAGTRSLIGSASAITWPRSTPGTSPYKRIRVTMFGTTITVYFDGTVMQTATDATFTTGKMGLRNDGGTSRYYQLRLQAVGDYVSGTPVGDIVTSDFVYTQVSLSTTDPTVNPQIQDLTTTANSPSVANGATIPQLHDPTKPFAEFYNNEMDSLAQSSGDFYWAVSNNALIFVARQAVAAPWILHSSDLLFTPTVKPTFSADLYRNRQTLTNCLGTVSVSNEQKIADGTATSWQMAYPLYSAPTIGVQGVSKTIGVQGIDTGKDFYWQAGSNSISQDASAATIPKGYILSVSYVGQYTTNVTRDNLAEQAARQAVEGGTGIVEAIEDGKQMLVSAAQTYADGLLARNGNNNTVEIVVTTRRAGAQKGQALPVFIPEHSINNAQLLITKIITTGEQLADGTILYEYQITATNGPSLTKWSTALGL